MMRSIDETIRDVRAVRLMLPGKAQSAAALAQVQRIETEGPAEVKAYALHTLIEAYWFGGDEEKAYVPFSQAVAWYDAHPEWFDDIDRNNLFWSFKWMVSGLKNYPRVPLAQLEATLADMERRFALEGYSMDAPYQQRWNLARHLGDPATATLFDEWVRQPRDDMSDCELCCAGDKVEYFIATGRADEGLQLMEATFANPSIRQECFSEPATMYAVAQFAYLERGKPGDAAKAVRAHHRCRSYWDGASAYGASAASLRHMQERAYTLTGPRGRCIEFLARTRNADAACRLLEDNRRFLAEADSPMARLTFLWHTGVALRVMVDDLGLGAHPVSLDQVPAATLGELWPWVRGQAEELAAAFDRRNHTSHQTDTMRADWQAGPFAEHLDLRVVLDEPARPVTGETGAKDLVGQGFTAAGVSPAPTGEAPATPPETTTDVTPQPPADPLAGLVQQAESLARRGDPEAAIATYLEAADGFEAAGQLLQAGFARAEAGHLALLLDDLAGAEACLRRAVQLLKAAATPPAFAAPVAACLAECLARQGDLAAAGDVLAQSAAQVDAALDAPPPPGVAEVVARSQADDLQWARVRLDEVRADNLIRAGQAADGAALAQAVAERYAGLDLVGEAAQAFQAAGQAWRGHDDEKAVWCLESAMEGFQIVLRRAEKSQAANLLVELLQNLGRDDEAAAVAAQR